jgi:hypothetical protein
MKNDELFVPWFEINRNYLSNASLIEDTKKQFKYCFTVEIDTVEIDNLFYTYEIDILKRTDIHQFVDKWTGYHFYGGSTVYLFFKNENDSFMARMIV